MTPNEVIQRAYKIATGDEEGISPADPVYIKYLELLNMFQRDWANEYLSSNERWASLEKKSTDSVADDLEQEYQVYDGEIATNPINHLGTRIILPNKEPIALKLVSLNELQNSEIPSYAISADGRRFYLNYNFAKTVKGGEIEYTIYRDIEDIAISQEDGILVSEPNWLVYMLAAEIARSDVVQSGQYGNLLSLAQNSMENMKNRQRSMRVANMRPWGDK